MKDLIEALTIFAKYTNTKWPTNCTHDFLAIMEIEEDTMSKNDQSKVFELGFFWSDEYDAWISFRFGSA